MWAYLLAFLVLAAMGALGVAALHRARLGLTRLEEVAFGVPLGTVVATLALIPLATLVGLNRVVVLTLAIVCAVWAAALWPERPAFAFPRWVRRLPFRRSTWKWKPRPLGIASLPTPLRLLSRPKLRRLGDLRRSDVHRWVPDGATLGRWIPTLALVALVVRLLVFWTGAITFDEDGMHVGHTFLHSDWPVHLGDTAAFAYGDNFPPENPRVLGEPFAYHYLAALTAAALMPLGLGLAEALELASFWGYVFVAIALYAFARRLTANRGAALLAVPLFLLGGGFGWLYKIPDIEAAHDIGDGLFGDPWSYAAQVDANVWVAPYAFRLASERAYAFGLPLVLLTLTLLLGAVRTGQRRCFVAAGVAAGLLPLAHQSSLLALGLVAPVFFVLSPRRWVWLPKPYLLGDGRRVLLFDPGWLPALAAFLVLALPQLYVQLGGGAGAASAIRFHVGWLADDDPWLWFWLKNLGWFVPLVLFALFDRSLLPPGGRRLLWAFMPVFAGVNLVLFQPAEWDNAKPLMYWFLAAAILVAALVAKTWQENPTLLVRSLLAGVVLMMLASGILADVDQMLGKDRFRFQDPAGLEIARLVRDGTPADAVFVTGLQSGHPIPTLAGRRTVMEFWTFAWSHGVDAFDRVLDVEAIYRFDPETPALLAKYGVDYVVIGPWEREHHQANEDAFREHYPVVLATEEYAVYDVDLRDE